MNIEANITEQLVRKVSEVRGDIFPPDEFAASDFELASAFIKICAKAHESYEYPEMVRHIMWALDEINQEREATDAMSLMEINPHLGGYWGKGEY
jgi:hypothetical protein